MSHERVATYRLQLHDTFRFEDVREIASYLTDLGISHLYLSPILQARSGSSHGYDVVDHHIVSASLGGPAALRALADEWDGGILVDVVPNHMAVDPSNRWWWDVLKHGPASEFAEYFDIDWNPSEERLKRSILVPVLGDHYGRVLEDGQLRIEQGSDGLVVCYFEHVFPLAPSSKPHDVDALNQDVDLLHEVLEAQHYRLAYWRVAGRDLNYRRFFAINDLVALRAERPEVFDATHRTVLDLLGDRIVDGLRIDHIDGLRYPAEYLDRLRRVAPGAYVVVEKILEGDEELRAEWAVDGTTGYEFIALVDGLFIDPDAEKPFTDLYARFTGITGPEDMAIGSKLEIMNTELSTDIERLTELFVAVCEDQRRFRDFTRPELRQALREALASFEVYRTYSDARTATVGAEDRRVIEDALRDARERRPDLDPELFALLSAVMLLEIKGEEEAALAMRFQQASGPVMAKAIEDTLFYRYNRFVGLNEVGGDPSVFGRSVEEFHRHNIRIYERSPRTMLAGSTHDTKRSEDVRARLALLSEIPDEWAATVERWSQMNERHRNGDWPDRNLEYLLYQTLIGAWPLTLDRARAYMDKAAKEAKVDTSWIAPNEAHDAALGAFVTAVMDDDRFMSELGSFVAPLIEPGYVNSLTQVLLRLTSPGVGDLYQGTEVWDLSLVDPDNRRPVDYDARRGLLDAVRSMDAATAWRQAHTGAPKMFLIHMALDVRRRHTRSFSASGDYQPLTVTGARSAHAVAFARGHQVVSVAPRLVLSLGGGWEDTTMDLPSGKWVNVLTSGRFEEGASLADLLREFPVALLEREDR